MISIAKPDLEDTEKERVLDVLDSGMLADGPEVRAFEEEFSNYCGADHGIATSNGTTALHAALKGLNIGEGDRVLTTPFSFIATANVIRLAGAEPVFADIDPDTYNLDPDAVEKAAREAGDIEAILAVHLYGLPAPMDELRALADEYDAYLIEDAAQSHGADYKGERVGTLGDVACFSFYPTKNMTTGEGGMVVTDDDTIAEPTAQFVNHGRTDTYSHADVGHNFRMTSMAAAIGRVQLDRLSDFIEARRNNAVALTNALEDTAVETPNEPDHMDHVFHQYTIRTADRERLQSHLDDHDIGCGVYYPECIHNQPAYAGVDHSAPVAEQTANEVLSLPVHPNVTSEDLDQIVEGVSTYE